MEGNLEIKLKLNEDNRGAFYIDNNNKTIAEMDIAIKNGQLVVFHTEVDPELKGQNIGRKL